jgi:hypothetical protein
MAKKYSGNIKELADGLYHMELHGGTIVAVENTIKKSGSITHVLFDDKKSHKFVKWGTDNKFPETVREVVQKNTILAARLSQRVARIYSGGIMWGTLEYDDNGNEIFKPAMAGAEADAIRAWLRKTNYQQWFYKGIANEVYFKQGWCEMVLNEGRTQIEKLVTHSAKYCRHGWKNQKTGQIDQTFIYGDWKKDANGNGAVALPTIDPLFDSVGQIQKLNARNVVMPVALPDVLQDYYALAPWDAARQSKWLSVAEQIPEFKAAIMKNQIAPKYLIKVSYDYWRTRYPDWEQLEQADRKAKYGAFITEVSETLSTAENAGKSIFSINKFNPATNTQVEGISIEEIGSKFKDGQYIEDSNEASTHILTALGEDPTLSGNGPGKNYGSGSGSDKKVAWDIAYALERPVQDMILEPLNVVRDFNGWNPQLVFRPRYGMQANLYSGTGVPKTSNDLQP